MSKTTTDDTKLALLFTAGELFAEHGFDSVSTRMIAEKENLYVEAFKYISKKEKRPTITTVLEEYPELQATPEGKAEIIKKTIFRLFNDYFVDDKFEWEQKLIIRELFSPSPAISTLIEEIFKPDIDGASEFYKHICPNASDDESYAWADMINGAILYYTMTKTPIEMLRGKGALTPDFFNTVAKMLAKSMILLASLPMPDDLKD